MKMSYYVQKYDIEKGVWKTLYISSKKKTATGLLKDLIKENPGTQYQVRRLLKTQSK
ncbi:hypothetical protein ES705_16845 [subsurface metagenome]